MDMIQPDNMFKLKENEGGIGMWDKYRKDSKQTICIIGVLTLAAKLC